MSVFGPWRLDPARLKLAGQSGFERLQFEVKFPITGVPPSRTHPNLDVVAPANPEIHRFFAQHRAEVADFADGLNDGDVTFHLLSYPALWGAWNEVGDSGLSAHAAALETRYLLELA